MVTAVTWPHGQHHLLQPEANPHPAAGSSVITASQTFKGLGVNRAFATESPSEQGPPGAQQPRGPDQSGRGWGCGGAEHSAVGSLTPTCLEQAPGLFEESLKTTPSMGSEHCPPGRGPRPQVSGCRSERKRQRQEGTPRPLHAEAGPPHAQRDQVVSSPTRLAGLAGPAHLPARSLCCPTAPGLPGPVKPAASSCAFLPPPEPLGKGASGRHGQRQGKGMQPEVRTQRSGRKDELQHEQVDDGSRDRSTDTVTNAQDREAKTWRGKK